MDAPQVEFYRIKRWSDFQHYSKRNPPWIKLHFALLSSQDWVLLDDASRVLAIACMLVASRHEGKIPSDPSYLKRVAYLNRTPNFKPLIDCGFIEVASVCKQMLADARPETEERQRREEAEQSSAVPAHACGDPSASPPARVNGFACYIPLNDGTEFGVSHDQVEEFGKLYPAVDITQTLNEIRGWNLANPAKRKTSRGVMTHINAWMAKEQNRGPKRGI